LTPHRLFYRLIKLKIEVAFLKKKIVLLSLRLFTAKETNPKESGVQVPLLKNNNKKAGGNRAH
jgi:hypothetical protein